MPDKKFRSVAGTRKRLKDMQDGTHAEVVAAVLEGEGVEVSSIGSPSDPAWNGTDPSASLISIMKACHAQLQIIADNTGV